MASSPKNRRSKVGIGLAANLPTITGSGVSPGDEYFATNTGAYYKCTVTSAGVKQWTVSALGAGIQAGTDQLALGTKDVTATVGTASRILITRRDLPGGGTALGLLGVTSPAVGVAGALFTVKALAEANQAVVVADISKFDWMVLN